MFNKVEREMDIQNDNVTDQESESVKKLQRALFYESQYRNAIVTDAICFFDANITQDIIENDFFFRDEEDDFISVPDYIGITTPCKFTDFINKWAEMMIPDLSQKAIADISVLSQRLVEIYNQGKREYVVNYWGEDVNCKKIYINQRFLLTRNEFGDICALSIIKDFTKLKEFDEEHHDDELKQYAYSDPITNGYNYIKFKEKLKEINKPGSIISVDIHSFKTINSILGVTKGDDVIRFIWQATTSALDEEQDEIAAHINADHYIIYTPETDEEEIAKKLKNITLALLVISVDIDIPQLHPYFGVSRYFTGQKIELAYNQAIIAKHNAKFQQDINYAFFNEEDTKRLIREKEILDSYDDALHKKEFKIWLQPKYTPKNKNLVGAEALVRWIKEDGTVIYPDSFIPLFERNNLIRNLDEFIFKHVCVLQKKWLDEGKHIVPVSVNLSRASLYYKGVAEEYKRIADTIGVPVSYVPIEITETAAISDEDVKNIIDRFHAAGFSLQMDDFGSGYSSLASLNMLHFDTLKLDKSLIDYIGNFGGNRLIEHTISLAKELGINITAEGVETEEQVQFLKHIGCDSIQGFFYSKPIPYQEYEKVLDKAIIPETTDSELDPLEDHVYGFNQNFYKPPRYSFLLNVSKNHLTDNTETQDWILETGLSLDDFDNSTENLVRDFICEESKEQFAKFMKTENILNSYCGTDETRIIEYTRLINNKPTKMRLLLHIFKVPGDEDLFAYIKVFNI